MSLGENTSLSKLETGILTATIGFTSSLCERCVNCDMLDYYMYNNTIHIKLCTPCT
jgi:hypothetical protein